MANIPGLAGASLPEGLASIDAGVEDANTGQKPLCIYFAAETQKGQLFEEKLLKAPEIGDSWSKVTFVKLVFEKGSDEAKKWRVSRAPVVLIYDCSNKEKPKKLYSITSGSPASVKAKIESAVKKVSK